MGKSKLTDAQWKEIISRVIAGEVIRELAKEFKISHTAINKRVGFQCKLVKQTAEQLVDAERKLSNMTASFQVETMNYASELRAMSSNMLGAGRASSATSKKLASMAEQMAIKLQYRDDMTCEEIENQLLLLKSVVALQNTANSANVIPASLLNINKATAEKLTELPVDENKMNEALIPDDPVQASRAYQLMIKG